MRFMKGVIVGAVVSTGVAIALNEGLNTKRIMKKGRKAIKKMGIM